MRALILAVGLLGSCPIAASAATFDLGRGHDPAVASRPDGHSLVAWAVSRRRDAVKIRAQRLDASARPIGPRVDLDFSSTHAKKRRHRSFEPAVTVDPATGDWLVTWHEQKVRRIRRRSATREVYRDTLRTVRVTDDDVHDFDARTVPSPSSTTAPAGYMSPKVACRPTDCLLVWNDRTGTVRAAAPGGPARRIGRARVFDYREVFVVPSADGYTLVWNDEDARNRPQAVGRTLAADGTPTGPQVRLSLRSGYIDDLRVAANAAGELLLGWTWITRATVEAKALSGTLQRFTPSLALAGQDNRRNGVLPDTISAISPRAEGWILATSCRDTYPATPFAECWRSVSAEGQLGDGYRLLPPNRHTLQQVVFGLDGTIVAYSDYRGHVLTKTVPVE